MSAITWWYTKGWVWRIHTYVARLIQIVDAFSIDLLLKTLFLPFRQIDTNRSAKGFPEMVNAFFNGLLSRTIGFVVRLLTIFAGIIVISLSFVFNIVEMAIWLVLPVVPIVGIILFAIGWVPYGGL